MTLADEIKRMIQSALESMEVTSANPTHINKLIQVNNIETPNLDEFVGSGDNAEGDIKQTKRTQEAVKKLEQFDKGKIGEINRFTSSQMGNLRGFVTDPVGFIIGSVFKKLAKGVGIIALATIIFEAVKFIISELLKPGRLLDIRFKRDINKELIAFRRREDQQKLKQGFSNIIITTQPRLRGGEGQIFNTFDAAAGRIAFPDNIGQAPLTIQSSGVSFSKSSGRRSSGGSRR